MKIKSARFADEVNVKTREGEREEREREKAEKKEAEERSKINPKFFVQSNHNNGSTNFLDDSMRDGEFWVKCIVVFFFF